MKRTVPLALGIVMVLVGLLWTGQGLGYLGGSPMSGQEFWAIVGPIVAGLGVALIFVAIQNRRR